MLSRAVLSTLAMALVASAQTFTDCNPMEKKCPADSAFGNKKLSCNLANDSCPDLEAYDGTTTTKSSDGLVFSIANEKQAPTMGTHKTMFFGELEVVLRCSPGQGIVTSVVLESANLDEIDWEWLGGDRMQVQTNYFGKGDTSTYDRGAYHDLEADHTTTFTTYTIKWTKKSIVWSVNGAPVRELKYEDAQGGERYPQTPMEVKIGTWTAGRSDAPKGTVEWAGGKADFSKGPFKGIYKSISIIDYAGGDGPAKSPVKEYVWADGSDGSWQSIKVVKGDGSSDDEEDDEEKTTTSKPTKTKDHSSSATESATSTDDEEEDKTTTAETTTITTVSTPGNATTTSHSSEDDAAPTAEPTTVPTDDGASAAFKGAASFAGVALAAVAVLLSQL